MSKDYKGGIFVHSNTGNEEIMEKEQEITKAWQGKTSNRCHIDILKLLTGPENWGTHFIYILISTNTSLFSLGITTEYRK